MLREEYCPTSFEGSGQAEVSISDASSVPLAEVRQTFGDPSAEKCLTVTDTACAVKVTDPSSGVLVWYANRLNAGDLIYLEGDASVVGQYSLSYD